MFQLGGGANQSSAEEEVNSRLQVREVRDRHEQLAAAAQNAIQLAERARLILVLEVLENVEAERPIERAVGERQTRHRPARHPRRRIVGVNAGDLETIGVLLDEDPFTATGIEDARASWKGVKISSHGRKLGEVSG